MFKANNKNIKVSDVVLIFLLLTLNRFHTFFSWEVFTSFYQRQLAYVENLKLVRCKQSKKLFLTLTWQRSLSYRNQWTGFYMIEISAMKELKYHNEKMHLQVMLKCLTSFNKPHLLELSYKELSESSTGLPWRKPEHLLCL